MCQINGIISEKRNQLEMKIPEPRNNVGPVINEYHRAKQEPPRPHMGCSQIGHKCEKYLWLSFRWAAPEQFDGRILRLFRRGHMEELTILEDLKAAGVTVHSGGAIQDRLDFGWHVAGSVDGVVSGLPNAPKTKALLECKTHSDKSFKDLQKKGVEKSKPIHWVQCHVYGYGLGLKRALYYAINKNDDSIYTEWIHIDSELAERYIRRAKHIVQAQEPPPPMTTNPTYFECKWCNFHSICMNKKPSTELHCRTCAHAEPLEDSTWHCNHYNAPIAEQYQRMGCERHLMIKEIS